MSPKILSSTYELREEIGFGGGGVVYKAWHLRLNKEVVLKKLRRDAAAGLQSQRAEADILKTLKHSYLPQLYDFLIEGEGEREEVYTVIDFIPGMSLDKPLKEGRRFPQQQVIRWAGQLCEALHYLHSQKPPILHSDIKPSNVMLTPSGDICLIDFNISLLLGDDGAVTVGRSHGYASPEQYGETAHSARQDAAEPGQGGGDSATELDRGGDDSATELDRGGGDDSATELDRGGGGDSATELDRGGGDDSATEPDRGGADPAAKSETKYTELLIKSGSPGSAAAVRSRPSSQGLPPRGASSSSAAKTLLDVRSDIYSLGATLYHLLTGEKPAIATGRVKPLGAFNMSISEGVAYIIEKAMHKDPARRFQSAAEMLRAVQNIRKLDRRWKTQTLTKDAAAVILTGLFAAAGILTYMGWQQMGVEKVVRYETAVYELASVQDQNEIERLFGGAIQLFPDRLGAYHAKGLALFRAGRYLECRAFIDASLITLRPSPSSPSDIAGLGDIYYILGACFFEQEDYANAVIYYGEALTYNRDNAEYYRDHAIALARAGDVTGAESLLSAAEGQVLSGEALDLLRGEIAHAKGQYPEAAAYFLDAIQAASDEYLMYRAYRICADTYRRQNDFESEIALLTKALGALGPEHANELTERLADAYVRGARSGAADSGDYYRQAAACFEELLERGYSTYLIRQNLAIVYQQLGDLSAAETVLLALETEYPADYRVPMRLAYLYADMQTRLANEARDYARTKLYHDKALALYEAQAKDGFSDPEMLMLKDMLAQLAQGGWL